MPRPDLPVLVVGAGPVGLMACLLLAGQGLGVRLIERRAGPLRAPAAHVLNARTFEICRAAGLDMPALLALTGNPEDAGQVLWVTRLAGEELGRLPFEQQGDDVLRLTPTPLRNLAQHHFEAFLRDALGPCGAPQVEHSRQWEDAVADADGVTSRVRNLSTGAVEEIRSRYLVAADGAGSRIRKWLGIEMEGPARLQSFVMIHFRADLRSVVKERPGILYWIADPEAGGTFVAHEIDREWVYMLPFDSDREGEADYPPARCEDLVRRGIGADVPLAIENVGTWVMTAQVAARLREGRVFLAGDAAHRFPPTGGLGLNSGIQDVHGLVWRLTAVEAGWAPPALLDSYELERRPVARDNAEQSLRNASRLLEVPQALGTLQEPTGARMRATLADPELRAGVEAAIANQAEHFDLLGLQLGYRYEAGALVPDGSAPPELANPVRGYAPSSRPGARLPHAWVRRDGRRVSTLDLLDPHGFTLLSSEPSPAWAEAAASLRDVPIRHVAIGRDAIDDEGHWREVGQIGPGGALLVRPDQHVGWRAASLPDDPTAALGVAVARILGSTGG